MCCGHVGAGVGVTVSRCHAQEGVAECSGGDGPEEGV